MARLAFGATLLFALVNIPLACYAQGKTACELLTRADVESVLGAALPHTRSGNGFCVYEGVPPVTTLQKQLSFTVRVTYSPVPNPAAVESWRKQVDEGSYDDPNEVPGLGDAAFWIGQPQYASLTVFRAGTMTLNLTGAPVAQVKALALKALGGNGKTGYVYGTRRPLPRPVLGKLGAKPSQIDQLKHVLTTKAEAGDTNAQLALGTLYEFGQRGADGNPKADYAGAAYWYQQASDQGKPRASYLLAILFRRGLGVPEHQQTALELFKKAAMAGYVPAMAPLAYLYENANTPTSQHREIQWAGEAAQKGDTDGLLLRGSLYNKGLLGGEPQYYYPLAMADYRKAAAGGNCAAMMDIGGLYFNGDGVAQDSMQAQDWFAKAEACSGPGLAWVREKSAKFREQAAAGRLPAVSQEATKLSARQMLAVGLLATLALAMAADVAKGSSSKGDSGGGATSGNWGYDAGAVADHNAELERQRQLACIYSGGKPALGCY